MATPSAQAVRIVRASIVTPSVPRQTPGAGATTTAGGRRETGRSRIASTMMVAANATSAAEWNATV